MNKALGHRAAESLLRAMRGFGVTGRVVDQKLLLSSGWTIYYTTGRTWPSITKQAGRTAGGASALVFSSPQTKAVRVMMDIESFALLMGNYERLMAETGRVGDAFTE